MQFYLEIMVISVLISASECERDLTFSGDDKTSRTISIVPVSHFCLVFLSCFNASRIAAADCRVNSNFLSIGVSVRSSATFVSVSCSSTSVNVSVSTKVLLISSKIKGSVDREPPISELSFVTSSTMRWM